VVVKEWPISVNIARPFLPVSATSLLIESINEMISMEDPKYALPALIIISDSSILVLFTSILFLTVVFWLLLSNHKWQKILYHYLIQDTIL